MFGTHTTVNLQAFMNYSNQIMGHAWISISTKDEHISSYGRGGGPQNNNNNSLILLLYLTKCHQKCYQAAQGNVNNQTFLFPIFRAGGGGVFYWDKKYFFC